MTRNESAPVLGKFSQYGTSPKYSLLGKWKVIDKTQDIPAANKYDVREMTKYTSKYTPLSRPCSFGKASRWGVPSKADNVTKGPGQYETASSTLKNDSISFPRSTRPSMEAHLGVKVGEIRPGPGLYEVRGKNRCSEPTLSQTTCSVAGRHGWFYDNKEAARKPGAGQYTLCHNQVELPVGTHTGIGTSLRPSIESHLGVGTNATGPGQYKTLTTLGGNVVCANAPKYSFTTASTRTKKDKPRDDPPLIPQVCGFGNGN